jgi:SAM-dependent methyltransferase
MAGARDRHRVLGASSPGMPQTGFSESSSPKRVWYPRRMAPNAYQIMQIRPAENLPAGALTEIAESTFFGLRRLGLRAYYRDAPAEPVRQIIFGAHLLSEEALRELPTDSIIYNSVELADDSPALTERFLETLRSHQVWDYSAENAQRLRDVGVGSVRYVPLGYVPELSRIGPVVEDIDVLFYGSVSPRRQAILDELKARGVNVVLLAGIYGEERDRVIARAKIVLSIHRTESKVFEILRLAYLLTNFKAVVAECGPETEVEAGIREAVRGVPYAGLVAACVELVADEGARRTLATRGHEVFSARPAEDILAAALGRERPPRSRIVSAVSSATPRPIPVPRTLVVGSGRDFKPEFFNVDINEAWGPDAVLDISAPDVIDTSLETERFGAVVLAEGSFDGIIANHVLEHIPELCRAMTNCLRLLRPGGQFQIQVPYDLSLGAWQDPTHVHAFNENSWRYYTDWHWFLGWVDMRFDLTFMQYEASDFGKELIKAGKTRDEIIRTPRAIDSMSVILRKRYQQESERQETLARLPGRRR